MDIATKLAAMNVAAIFPNPQVMLKYGMSFFTRTLRLKPDPRPFPL